MTGWLFHSAWSPSLVLLVGVVTAAALTGIGLLALEVVGVDLPSPWRVPAGILLGVELLALDVQILGWTHVATRPVLIAGWWLYVAVGLLYLWSARPRERPRVRWHWHPVLALAAVAAVAMLLVATAPSTKIDEIFYHMLLPSRLVTDGALRFYRYPWEGAAWPQMLFQIASAPVHALGVPDAPNLVSWCIGLVLLAFGWRVTAGSQRSAVAPGLLLVALTVGTYPPVWWTTAGAHAMGDLATACAVVALCAPELLRARVPPRTFVVAVALFALAAASTKISLLPLALALTTVAVVQAWRDDAAGSRSQIVAVALGPWVLFYVPVVLATWLQSGAPFGPFEAWLFPTTVYDAAHIHRVFDLVRQTGQHQFTSIPWELLARRTPLLWLAALGALFATTLPARQRLLAAAILVAQLTAIALLLPWDPRFLSGIPIALAILFARYPRPRLAASLSRPAIAGALVVILVLPWLGAELWYSAAFARVSTGIEPVETFRERHIPLWRDLGPIDSLLPRDAVVLVDGYRLGGVYSPRPIVWTAADIVGRPPVYQLGPRCTVTNPAFGAGAVVYRDTAAVIEAPRNPLREAVEGPVCVRELLWRGE